MKTAIILGSLGQDGKLLTQLLLGLDYRVIGISLDSVEYFGGYNRDQLPSKLSIDHLDEVTALIQKTQPNEVYHLAAFHHSSEDKVEESLSTIDLSYRINVRSLLCFLEAIRNYSPQTRVFYAASSHIFGQPEVSPQSESTPLKPNSVYGIDKSAGLLYARMYRGQYRLFTSTGILYNHESKYRPDVFLSKKITKAVLRIYRKQQSELILGNLDAKIDWGYASDFVDAFHKILQIDEPDDYVIATGEAHSVREFVEMAFGTFGLNWRDYVREDHSLITRKDSFQGNSNEIVKIGNFEKLRKATGWTPKTSFKEMIHLLLKDEAAQQNI